VPFLISVEMKKGANLMVRHDQQIDASNFVCFIFENISALFETVFFKKGAECCHGCQTG